MSIFGVHSVKSCCILSISASYRVFVYGKILQILTCVCVVVGHGFVSTSASFIQLPLLGAGGFDTICTVASQNHCDRSTTCRLCRL